MLALAVFLMGPLSACGKSQEEVQQQKLQAEFDSAMDDLYNPEPPPGYKPDAALVQGSCNNAELMELACEKYGTTCEEAKLARKQCEQFKSM